jgi:hypothetical protein
MLNATVWGVGILSKAAAQAATAQQGGSMRVGKSRKSWNLEDIAHEVGLTGGMSLALQHCQCHSKSVTVYNCNSTKKRLTMWGVRKAQRGWGGGWED